MLAASRTMRARLERRVPGVGTDLGWETVATLDLPVLGIDGTTVSWAGALELPTALAPRRPGDNTTCASWWRSGSACRQIRIRQRVRPGVEARIVYADHLPL